MWRTHSCERKLQPHSSDILKTNALENTTPDGPRHSRLLCRNHPSQVAGIRRDAARWKTGAVEWLSRKSSVLPVHPYHLTALPKNHSGSEWHSEGTGRQGIRRRGRHVE